MGALALPLLFALPPPVDAADATLRVKARLREGPSKTTSLLGWVDAGTTVEVLAEQSGWRQVQVPDGRTGYVWGQHFAAVASPTASTSSTLVQQAPPAPAQGAASDDLRSLRADVDALKNQPEAATLAALEQLRGEVARLASAHQELARRLDGRAVVPEAPMAVAPVNGPAGAAVIFLVAGGLVGWIASRLVQRWRDRRSRIRI